MGDARTTNCPFKAVKEMGKIKRGTYNYRFETKKQIIAVRWKDNKSVALASNLDRIEPLATTKKWSKKLKKKCQYLSPYDQKLQQIHGRVGAL